MLRAANQRLNGFMASLARSSLMSHESLQYGCIASGFLTGVFFFLGLIAAGVFPPPRPSMTAEETAHFFNRHAEGARAGASLITLSGLFYLPFCAALTHQMSRIPNVPPLIHRLQLAAAAGGLWAFVLPGIILATLTYRLDRAPELTLLLSDLFWFTANMGWQSFLVQDWCFAWAIIVDTRKNTPLPKWLALINIVLPMFYFSASICHLSKHGPIAWNGPLTFWMPSIVYASCLGFDAWSLYYMIREEALELKQRGAVTVVQEVEPAPSARSESVDQEKVIM